MSNTVTIHFKCEGRVNGIVFKTSVEEITMSMVEARLYKKLGLDESKVKMQLSYSVRLYGSEEKSYICDDEDMLAYLVHLDNENRRCLMIVDLLSKPEITELQSRAGKSSYGMNYDSQGIEDERGEVGLNAITLHIDNGERNEEEEEEEDHDAYDSDYESGDESDDESDDESVDESDDDECEGERGDHADIPDFYIEEPPVVEPSQSVEPWEDGLGLSLHQEFSSKKDVMKVVHRGAFANSFGYVIKNSDTKRWVAKCGEQSCKWQVRATKITNSDCFAIRTYTNMHTCNRASQIEEGRKKRKASAHLVASIVSDEYIGRLEKPTPKEIMALVTSRVGIDISYSTALRGKNQAISDMRGTPEENYAMLYRYLYVLEELNHGTKTAVELDRLGKFKYLFIALGACIDGFQFMRKVIIVDATFLKAGFGGVLVFAAAQDPNRHIYPIAFGVLDGENNDSWAWFFENLKTVVADSSELVFVSDRNVSLINAVASVYPQAHHGYCLWHLSQNVKGHGPSASRAAIAQKFQECGMANTVAEFNVRYGEFKQRYPSAAKYVEDSTVPEKWARCVTPVARYNLDTSNSVESLNRTFKDARKYSLIAMLDAIVRKISDWFNEHRNESVSGTSANTLVPLVENFHHANWPRAEKLTVREVNGYELEYEVCDADGKLYLVNLANKTCTCRFYDIHHYLCVHALSAFITFKKQGRPDIHINLHDLCSKYYLTEMWTLAYTRSIYVVPDKSTWIVPDYIMEKQIIPPDRVISKGRRKENRFPSSGERRRKRRTQNKLKRGRTLPWLLYGEDYA